MANEAGTFQEMLTDQLRKLFPEARLDGARNNVNINCPLCNKDGNPDRNRHMSICLGNNGKPLYFNCYRDSSHKGLLTSTNLLELSYASPVQPDLGFLELLDEMVRKNGNISRHKLKQNGIYRIATANVYDNDKLNEVKRRYICDRIGLDLPIAELVRNKIVFSIKDLLAYNGITRITRSKDIIDGLDKYFVGFLTNNNGTIILRNITNGEVKLPEKLNERYIKYTVFQGAPAGYYIIPSQCNIYKHIDIHMAEGTFDILSIFYNLRGANRINNIYVSIGGNSYLSLIRHFLCDMGLIDVTFHIYIDIDIKKNVLPEIKGALLPLNIESHVHMNAVEGEKDFGVPLQKIKEYSYRLT